jgi:hypothetical protein
MGLLAMNKPSMLRRGVKHLVLFFGMLLCVLFAVKLGLTLLGTEEQQIQALERWKNSPALTWIRYGLYLLIIICWKPMLKKINHRFSEDFIKASYRPLIVCLVLYEFFLARNLLGQLIH